MVSVIINFTGESDVTGQQWDIDCISDITQFPLPQHWPSHGSSCQARLEGIPSADKAAWGQAKSTDPVCRRRSWGWQQLHLEKQLFSAAKAVLCKVWHECMAEDIY